MLDLLYLPLGDQLCHETGRNRHLADCLGVALAVCQLAANQQRVLGAQGRVQVL